MHGLASLSSFLLLLACQQTRPAAKERPPLDLDQLIAALEPKEAPPAPPAIPDDLGEWALKVLGDKLNVDDAAVMAARGEQLENLQLAMAAAYVARPATTVASCRTGGICSPQAATVYVPAGRRVEHGRQCVRIGVLPVADEELLRHGHPHY
jgi:hypothetical protein